MRDGFVTEGSSTNAWIVTRDGEVVTRPADHGILRGITRTVVLDVIAEHGLKLEERPFTVDEAYAAREAFVTSASQFVMPVVRIDGRPVGNGAPGLIATRAAARFPRPRRNRLTKSARESSPVSARKFGLRASAGVPSNGRAPSPRAGARPIAGEAT